MSTDTSARSSSSTAPDGDRYDSSAAGIARELVSEITDDDVPGLAAEVAYHAIFSIPALIVVLITLAAVVDNFASFELADRLREIISANAPASTQDILNALVENAVEQVDGSLASIGLASALLVAIWAGSNGVGALVKAFNRAYDATEVRSFPRKKATAILLTIMLGLVVNLAFVLWVFGGQIGSWIAREFTMGATFDTFWNLSRIPVGVVVIILMLSLLYYFGPTAEQEFRWVLPGAVLATVLWGALVLGFSLYLRFSNPGSAYGALGGMIVFLFFLYLTALIFLVGAEFNAVLARRYDERYQRSLAGRQPAVESYVAEPGIVESRDRLPVTIGGLAIGAVATVGIVVVSVLGRRNQA